MADHVARLTPKSVEAEQSVIGSLLLDSSLWERVIDTLVVKDFYQPEHQTIFEMFMKLVEVNKVCDVVTLTDALKKEHLLTGKLTESYLYELTNNTPKAINIEAYTKIVRDHSVARKLIIAGQYIADLAYSPKGRESTELIDEAERYILEVSKLGHSERGPVGVKYLTAEAVERIRALSNGEFDKNSLRTNFRDFDKLTCGLQKGDLVVLAGRPSMGKTALVMNIVEHIVLQLKKTVVVFSLEMPGDSLVMRMMSSLGRIEQHRIRSGKVDAHSWTRINSTASMISSKSLFIDDSSTLTPMELRSRARRLAREQGGLDLIVVDYLQLMHVPGYKSNRNLEISEISRSLKVLAKELSVPVIALSQLNRGLEQREEKRPMMSDLRESGAIEQDADLIVFVYRDEVYHKDSADRGTAEIIIAKHRNGPIGRVRLTFLAHLLRFENHASEKEVICALPPQAMKEGVA